MWANVGSNLEFRKKFLFNGKTVPNFLHVQLIVVDCQHILQPVRYI